VLLAGRAFTPEVAYRWTTISSGALVAGLGLYLVVTRLRGARHARAHEHGHDHAHGHTHERPAGKFGLATLAVSGGILPSPSALIALLAAVAIGRVVFGLALVLAFGIGLATVLGSASLGYASGYCSRSRATMARPGSVKYRPPSFNTAQLGTSNFGPTRTRSGNCAATRMVGFMKDPCGS
jgi:ABC-type nickel/cobalt efflux system permease component RcnA